MIQVLDRSAAILDLVAHGTQTLTDLSHETGLPKPTVHNILATLEQLGIVERGVDKRYAIGPRAISWAEPRIRRDALRQAAELAVTRLAERLGETAHVAVLRHGQRVIIAHMHSTQTVTVNTHVMEQRPLFSGGSGPVLLAFLGPEELDDVVRLHGLPGDEWGEIRSRDALEAALGRIRQDGLFSRRTNDGQAQLLSTPVLSSDGRCWAAICLSLPLSRFLGEHRDLVERELRLAAQLMADELERMSSPGAQPPSAPLSANGQDLPGERRGAMR